MSKQLVYKDSTWILNLVLVVVFIIGGLFLLNQVNQTIVNRELIQRGKFLSEMCDDRPNWTYFARCNALHDGPACTHESQSKLMQFYEPIDVACSRFEPERKFRFPINDPERVEVAEVSG